MRFLQRHLRSSEPPDRVLVILISVAISIMLVALQVTSPITNDHELLMLVVPVALMTVGFGLRGGVLAATLALVTYAVWAYTASIETSVVEVLEFPITFFTVAFATGFEFDRREHAQTLMTAIVNGTTDSIYAKDLEDRYLLANSTVEAMAQADHGDLLGRKALPLMVASGVMTQDEADRARQDDIEAAQQRVTSTIEEEFSRHGERLVFLNTKGPLIDRGGKVIGVFGIARDITDRKELEKTVLNAAQQGYIEYERARSDYAKLIRHRLMNPLAVIRGNAQTILDLKSIDPAVRDELCNLIVNATRDIEQASVQPECASEAEQGLNAIPEVDDELLNG